jgi:rhodanese-related sulfurtransferase
MATIKEDIVILFCQTGKRSKEAAALLSANVGSTKKIYCLQGGIAKWIEHGKREA